MAGAENGGGRKYISPAMREELMALIKAGKTNDAAHLLEKKGGRGGAWKSITAQDAKSPLGKNVRVTVETPKGGVKRMVRAVSSFKGKKSYISLNPKDF